MKHACINEVDDKEEEGCSSLNLDDPGNWKIIDQRTRDYLVERGPKRVDDISFPKDLKNATRVGQLGNDGFKDWHNLHRLAKNTLPFRGDDERLNVENNGLFLQMVKIVSEFDPIMKEHLRRANAKEIQYTYLGKKIQNELIQLLANEVRNAIVKKVKHAKYFAVILDCTPDASHEEQMSLIVRFVDDSANLPIVEEHWPKFLKADDTTGLGLTTELQKALIKLDLNIDDIRG
ncbi:uncharacterized protein LOC111384400 [Olea europaea var. sylvestris]|uniref:uncharacterized protein LOC111384400 n=1 Tax=Olea europaea var. sylvestris TaxID=158386 RepID=UPI000C1CF0CA|nr:uncharacterized protein LOC111384400 [Olea europaea var. sylvestris]